MCPLDAGILPELLLRKPDMTHLRLAIGLLSLLAASACQPRAEESSGSAGPADPSVPELDGGPAPAREEVRDLEGAPIDLVPPGGPADSPCALFSATEIGAFLGKAVAEGKQQDEACLWEAADAHGFVHVQVAPASRHAPPDGQVGFETVAALGAGAYVVPIPDGYAGGAVDGDDAVMISVGGLLNARDIAVELLRQSVERNG